MFYSFNYIFYNIIIFLKDITETVRLAVLHGLATIDASMQLCQKHCMRFAFPRQIIVIRIQ